MNRSQDFLASRLETEEGPSLGNQLSGPGTDNVDPQDLAVFLLGHHLHEPLRLAENLSARQCAERELSALDRQSALPRLIFRQSDPRHFRLAVRAPGDPVV